MYSLQKFYNLRYQRLTNQELEELKDDFITFLASNTITGDEWAKLKAEEPSKAEKLIEIFSDIVYEKALSNCDCMERFHPHEFRAYKFSDNKVHLIVVRIKPDMNIQFERQSFTQTILNGLKKNQVEFFEATREYKKTKEMEMFAVLKEGAYLTNDTNYKQLQKLTKPHLR